MRRNRRIYPAELLPIALTVAGGFLALRYAAIDLWQWVQTGTLSFTNLADALETVGVHTPSVCNHVPAAAAFAGLAVIGERLVARAYAAAAAGELAPD